MNIKYGDMFKTKEKSIMILATGNSYIKENGTVTMGRGAALELAIEVPGIAKDLAPKIPHLGFYGVVGLKYGDRIYGLFQTKTHFRLDSTIELITKSINKLKNLSRINIPIHMNFPGINNDGLAHREDEIAQLLSVLPDNVTVWK